MRYLTMLCTIFSVGTCFAYQTVLNQEFDAFTPGALPQGDTASQGGLWNSPTFVVWDANSLSPNNALKMVFDINQTPCVGSTSAAIVPQGTGFTLSFWVYSVSDPNVHADGGSFLIYMGNSNTDVTDPYAQILETTSVGTIYGIDQKNVVDAVGYKINGGRLVQNKWVGIKIAVTSWNDGSGYGLFNTYYNNNDGKGWVKRLSGTRFTSAYMSAGVNSIGLVPRTGINYFDNINITIDSGYQTCDELRAGGQMIAGDVNADCKVDIEDLYVVILEWNNCFIPGDSMCEILW